MESLQDSFKSSEEGASQQFQSKVRLFNAQRYKENPRSYIVWPVGLCKYVKCLCLCLRAQSEKVLTAIAFMEGCLRQKAPSLHKEYGSMTFFFASKQPQISVTTDTKGNLQSLRQWLMIYTEPYTTSCDAWYVLTPFCCSQHEAFQQFVLQ